MIDLTKFIIEEFGLTGLLVVISVGILWFSFRHVSKILAKIDKVHIYYNNIISKQNKDHEGRTQELNKGHEKRVTRMTEQFTGSLDIISQRHQEDHQTSEKHHKEIKGIVSEVKNLLLYENVDKTRH